MQENTKKASAQFCIMRNRKAELPAEQISDSTACFLTKVTSVLDSSDRSKIAALFILFYIQQLIVSNQAGPRFLDSLAIPPKVESIPANFSACQQSSQVFVFILS